MGGNLEMIIYSSHQEKFKSYKYPVSVDNRNSIEEEIREKFILGNKAYLEVN